MRPFRAIALRLLWRKVPSLWRYSCLAALLALNSVSAQTLAPIGITASRTVTTSYQSTARLGPAGSIYLGGSFGSYLGISAPAPTNSYGDTSKNAYYVSRIDAAGNTVFTTALGAVTLAAMHIDSAGNVFVSGAATSTGFYTSPGAYRSSAPQNAWQFVCKLSATDGSAVYCTWLDFFGTDGSADGIDQQGNLIAVAGRAQFGGTTPPPSHGSLDAGSGHIYVAKLNPAGSALTYTAAFGGSGADIPSVTTVDPAGNIYIAGFTTSPDFPTTPGAVVTSNAQLNASFLSKLSADGTTLLFSTLGPAGETPVELALDSANDPQVLYGNPATAATGVRRYNAAGSAILFDASSYLTNISPGTVSNAAMAIDTAGDTSLAFSIGTIAAPLVNPTVSCQVSAAMPFGGNGFLIRFDPTGTVRQATYLTQSLSSVFDDIAVNAGSVTIAAWSPALPVGNTFPTGALPALQILTLAAAPQINLACIGNSATLLASPLAAGEIVSLFGQGIGPAAPIIGVPAPQNPLTLQYPVTLGTTSVTFDGIPAPLLYVSSGQINTVVPFSAQNTTHVCVTFFFNAPSCMDAALAPAAPGIFTIPATPGSIPYAAAVNQDTTINSASNPAPRGSVITIFATGLGPLSSTPAYGALVGLPLLTQSLTVTIASPSEQFKASGEIITTPAWVGQAPDEIAGLSQINFVVPDLPATNQISILVNTPGALVTSQQALIWVK